MANNETSSPVSLDKVTVFITRGPAHAREVLVFRHPVGGVQLPAGTVEEGEPAETAALREAWEETGVAALSVVAHLATQQTPLRLAGDRAVLRRIALRQSPEPDAPEIESPSWFLGLRRGLFVHQSGEAPGGWAKVVYEEFDGPSHLAAAPSRMVEGWVPMDAITSSVVRHFFHLASTEATRDTWIQSAEEWEFQFEPFWVPLTPGGEVQDLIPSQAVWLTEFADRLLVLSEA
jgi:8-oxo-dGTP pyrophosphatase MutT (NUDIX family)